MSAPGWASSNPPTRDASLALRPGLASLASAALTLVVGCTVDTELGVAAEVQGAAITVTGMGMDDVIGVAIPTRFRVGEHAEGRKMFVIQRAELVVGETPVAQIGIDYPDGFTGQLDPGTDQTVTLTGATPPGDFPDARGHLCGAASVRVLVRWQDVTPGMTPLPGDFGVAEGETSDVTCD